MEGSLKAVRDTIDTIGSVFGKALFRSDL